MPLPYHLILILILNLTSSIFFVSFLSLPLLTHQQQQTPLNSAEQESVYLALESLNPETPWRSLYPDDLCQSSPHGILCAYFPTLILNDTVFTPHIIELNFGFVFDFSDNPPCSPNSSFPFSLSSFTHLRKLFFYRCFTLSPVLLPSFDTLSLSSQLEEIVFIDNPSLFGTLTGTFRKFTSLRRFIFTHSNVSGGFPDEITKLSSLEQLTLSANVNLVKGIPENVGNLVNLKVLDLSRNMLDNFIPESLGNLKMLIKLDLSGNNFVGKIPESLKNLQSLEFLDLGYNKFGNFGVPLFLGEMPKLREVYLSGNPLGGVIPEIWENLGGILGIGLSGVGLVGKIPSSMGIYLKNASYIGLDNNKLEGTVPKELGLLEQVNELNLQNNQLKGRIPFTAKFVARVGKKLKLEGNSGICIDESMRWCVELLGNGLRNLTSCNFSKEIPKDALLFNDSGYIAALRSGSSAPHLNWCLVIFLGALWSFYIVDG